MKKSILIGAIVAFAFVAPSFAKQATANCEVSMPNGKTLKKKCTFSSEPDGSFTLYPLTDTDLMPGVSYLTVEVKKKGEGISYYSNPTNYDTVQLGKVVRGTGAKSACWFGTKLKVCAK